MLLGLQGEVRVFGGVLGIVPVKPSQTTALLPWRVTDMNQQLIDNTLALVFYIVFIAWSAWISFESIGDRL